MASQTPRCALPAIVVEDAPKKTTIRGMADAVTPGQKGVLEHAAKEEFRLKFAHASKSQVKSLISMLGNLNEANNRYHVYLLQLKPNSKLQFVVNDVQQAREVVYDVDKDKVELGMETFSKGLRNVYYYYKFRGTKKSKRTGDKTVDDLADMEALRVYHRHLWTPAGSALHKWIMTESFVNESFDAELRRRVDTLIENSGELYQYKGGAPILHILNSTIQNLFYLVFETHPSLKVPAPKDKSIPKELKQPQYKTTDGIKALYAATSVNRVEWDEKAGAATTASGVNQDANYRIRSGLIDKIKLRKEHGQYVYHDFTVDRIFMKDFMSITSLGTFSSEYIDALYNRYKNFVISAKPVVQGEDVSRRYATREQFLGNDTYRQALGDLQVYVSGVYKQIKENSNASKPATVRATNRVHMMSLLEG